ncbi:glycosyltransferase [Bacteroides fragilis]|nr:glycosyltransferase [Bacteroides fragilis]
MKISVCLASYNGQLFIEQQIKSILAQLSEYDELIVSDDCSTDKTLEIVETLNDKRIKIFSGIRYGSPIRNFENALKHATGDVIFLSDQDDVWLPNKVKIMTSYFHQYDVVVSNCSIVDKELNIIKDSFFLSVNTRKGFFNNLYDNHYLGCCMAFKKKSIRYHFAIP